MECKSESDVCSANDEERTQQRLSKRNGASNSKKAADEAFHSSNTPTTCCYDQEPYLEATVTIVLSSNPVSSHGWTEKQWHIIPATTKATKS